MTASINPSAPPEQPPPGASRCCGRCSHRNPTAHEAGQSPPGIAFRMILAMVIVLAVATVALFVATEKLDMVTCLVAISACMGTATWIAVELALWRVTRALEVLEDLTEKIRIHHEEMDTELTAVRSLVMDVYKAQLAQQGDNR